MAGSGCRAGVLAERDHLGRPTVEVQAQQRAQAGLFQGDPYGD
jgi:hypothetical protein